MPGISERVVRGIAKSCQKLHKCAEICYVDTLINTKKGTTTV